MVVQSMTHHDNGKKDAAVNILHLCCKTCLILDFLVLMKRGMLFFGDVALLLSLRFLVERECNDY